MLIQTILPVLGLAFNCTRISKDDRFWDISSLFRTYQNISLETVQHGNTSFDTINLIMDLCNPIPSNGSIDDCPVNSSICLIVTNWKANSPRVISIQGLSMDKVDIEIEKEGDKLEIEMKSLLGRLDLDLICNPKIIDSQLKIQKFDLSSAKVEMVWENQNACPKIENSESHGSIIGTIGWYFFTTLCVYFTIGTAYKVIILRGDSI